MPDGRRHRGPHPDDVRAFAPDRVPPLVAAAEDLAWLLERGYAPASSIKLVGDRWRLDERQRMAVVRSTCSPTLAAGRAAREVSDLGDQPVLVDTYNVLTTVEAAMAGGLILAARDGTYRDLASMHGTFRAVDETEPALEAIGRHLSRQGPRACTWLLDRPVSNSGRLAERMRTLFATHGWPWAVELVNDPDPLMRRSPDVAATADSVILDAASAWYNLARRVVVETVPDAWVIDLAGRPADPRGRSHPSSSRGATEGNEPRALP